MTTALADYFHSHEAARFSALSSDALAEKSFPLLHKRLEPLAFWLLEINACANLRFPEECRQINARVALLKESSEGWLAERFFEEQPERETIPFAALFCAYGIKDLEEGVLLAPLDKIAHVAAVNLCRSVEKLEAGIAKKKAEGKIEERVNGVIRSFLSFCSVFVGEKG